ncbi:MAG: hypothetical protein IT364_00095, partial [Candidatus Hydrogenedentes bacterium]|nr:hypothetical protein [Candidatus Hydrogenedentota bacterium]
MNQFPLLEILFFIAAFFAPPDTAEIAVSGPDYSRKWVLSGGAWTDDGAVWSVRGRAVAVQKPPREDRITDVLEFVRVAIGHDWT